MKSNNKIIIAGNHFGIFQLLKCISFDEIAAFIVPYNRPESINYLKFISFTKRIPLIIHQKNDTEEYFSFVNEISNYENCKLLSNSYPLIFKSDFLKLFEKRAFNIHSSLLPQNRGCEPIQWTIMKGDKKTGVTIHRIEKGIDTGNIVAQTEVEISFDDTWITLSDKLQHKKIELIKENFNLLKSNSFVEVKQDEKKSTVNKKITDNDLLIDFEKMTNIQIYNLCRANISPSKPAFYYAKNEKVILRKFVTFDKICDLRLELLKLNATNIL